MAFDSAKLGFPDHVHDLDAGDQDSGVTKALESEHRPGDPFDGTVVTVLGGDHCTAIATLQAQARRHPDLCLLWVDAHPDLCDYSRGGHWTCGCAMRRALEVSGIDPGRVVIAAGRDYDPEELDFIRSRGVLLVSARELAGDPLRSAQAIAKQLAGKKVHVSFDIDALDPAFAPGTEIPSPGGMSTRQALEMLRTATAGSRPVGFDIVEVSPPFDNGDITSFAALKLIFEFWGMSWNGNR